MKKQNILLIEPFLPYPLCSGGHQAIFNGILALKELYNIYILCYIEDSEYKETDIDDFKNRTNIPNVYTYIKKKEDNGIRLNLFQHIIAYLFYRFVPQQKNKDDIGDKFLKTPSYPIEFLNKINQIIKDNNIDIVQIEMPWFISLVCCLPNNIKKVFVHHEIAFERNRLSVEQAGENLYRNSAVEVNKTLEIGLLNKYDVIITLSEADKLKLIENGVVKPVFSSFAIVTPNEKQLSLKENCFNLSFVGPEKHNPNKKGILWFLDNCWNQLLQKDSRYKLQIFSKWKESTQKEIQEKYNNIEFMGFVDDLSSALENTIMIVPITIGSGIRMKILEAANIGVPFVTTTVGVEGLPFNNNKDCFIADEPNEFIASIIKLQDKNLRHSFSISAKEIVKRNYSIEALKENRKIIMTKI